MHPGAAGLHAAAHSMPRVHRPALDVDEISRPHVRTDIYEARPAAELSHCQREFEM